MRLGWVKYGAVAWLFAAQGLLFLFVPSLLLTTYASPDETAVAVTARLFAEQSEFRMVDSLLEVLPWVHPRSFVTQSNAMVPVGFLGMPLLAAICWNFFGEYGLLFLTPLLALSCIYPLWRFLRKLGFAVQVAGVAVWLSFPMVILYANRGLFPNLAMVCLMVWSAYLVWHKKKNVEFAAAGILFGLAVTIRPTEIFWAVPWIVAAFLEGKTITEVKEYKKQLTVIVISSAIIPVFAALMAWKTYGSPWLIGYWLRDPAYDGPRTTDAASVLANPERIWPFGLHPRAIWINAENYLVQILGPWIAVALIAIATWSKRNAAKLPIAVGLWTALVLCIIYGNTVYQDHVGHNVVSVGNSYLRYLLPLAPFFALSAAALSSRLMEALPKNRARFSVNILVAVLVGMGVWTAFARDDEGINAVIPELVRYQTVRQDAIGIYGKEAVVVSDRSDKIFFPSLRAVSPIPDDSKLTDLIAYYPGQVLLFDTTYKTEKIEDFENRGFYLNPILATKNQTLYELTLLPVTQELDKEFELQQ